MKTKLMLMSLLISSTAFAFNKHELTTVAESLYQKNLARCNSDAECVNIAEIKNKGNLEFINALTKDLSGGSGNLCKERFKTNLYTKTQKKIIEKFPEYIDTYMEGCNQDLYKDFGLIYGIIVLHEAVHGVDLGFKSNKRGVYLINDTFLEISNDIYGVSNLVNPIVKAMDGDFETEDNYFGSMHTGYLLDPEAAAATSLGGIASELNGYTHGFQYERQIRKILSNQNYIGSSQLDGVYYFLTVFNIYLDQLKKMDSNKFEQVKKYKKVISSLFNQAIDQLKDFDHCSNAEVTFFSSEWHNFIKKFPVSPAMKEFIREGDDKLLRCQL